jgi:hypothetical protein
MAAELTPVRLDRLSQWDDWKPYVQEVEYFDKPRNEWAIAVVCLFDRSRVPKSFTLGDNLHREYIPVIPKTLLEEALKKYFESSSGKQQTEDNHSTGLNGDVRVQREEKRPQTKSPSKPPLFRRRLRQRARMGDSREHPRAREIHDITNDSQLVYLMPSCWNQVPHFLIGKASDDYTDAIILGLAAQGTDSLIGCLAISRKIFENGTLYTNFRISAVKALARQIPFVNEQGSNYWTKFPQIAPSTRSDKSWDEIGRGGSISFRLSRFYSYDQMTPLIYPDSMNGPLAEVSGIFTIFGCWCRFLYLCVL